MVTILYRAQGEPDLSGTSHFTDVSPGQWYSDAVVWAGSQGIVQGYGNGLFGAEAPVTKEQMEIMPTGRESRLWPSPPPVPRLPPRSTGN